MPAPYNRVRKHPMNEHADQDKLGRELWRRCLRSARGPAGAAGVEELAPMDANALAAYLDGTARPEEVARVEAHLASDPQLLEEVMELRGLVPVEPAAAPAALLARAKALAPVRASVATRPAAAGGLVRPWLRRLQWAAAAAALVVASLGGYSFGEGTFRDRLRADASAAAASFQGVEELISEPILGVPDEVNGENGGDS
jgi:anti-sigma factor RsiW